MWLSNRLFKASSNDDQHGLVSNADYGELIDEAEGGGGAGPASGSSSSSNRNGKMASSSSSSPPSYVESRLQPILNHLPCYHMTKRYQIALLSSLGFLISFGIRCNMGVAVVVMVHNQTKVDEHGNVTIIVSAICNPDQTTPYVYIYVSS